MPETNQSTNDFHSSPLYRLTFPQRVHRLLDQAERDNQQHIVSWVNQGAAFKVHDFKAFERDLLPLYFSATKYTSFTRALHAHGFKCERSGRDTGVFSHPWFNRNDTKMLARIKRTKPNKNHSNAAIAQSRSSAIPATAASFSSSVINSTAGLQNLWQRLGLTASRQKPARFQSRLANLIASSTPCQLGTPMESDGASAASHYRYSIFHDQKAPSASGPGTIARDDQTQSSAKRRPHLIDRIGLVSHSSMEEERGFESLSVTKRLNTNFPSLLDKPSSKSDSTEAVFGQLFHTVRSQGTKSLPTLSPASHMVIPTVSANDIEALKPKKQSTDNLLASPNSPKPEEQGSDFYNWISMTSLEPRSIQAMKKSPNDVNQECRFC